jgi:hypothetical protein
MMLNNWLSQEKENQGCTKGDTPHNDVERYKTVAIENKSCHQISGDLRRHVVSPKIPIVKTFSVFSGTVRNILALGNPDCSTSNARGEGDEIV